MSMLRARLSFFVVNMILSCYSYPRNLKETFCMKKLTAFLYNENIDTYTITPVSFELTEELDVKLRACLLDKHGSYADLLRLEDIISEYPNDVLNICLNIPFESINVFSIIISNTEFGNAEHSIDKRTFCEALSTTKRISTLASFVAFTEEHFPSCRSRAILATNSLSFRIVDDQLYIDSVNTELGVSIKLLSAISKNWDAYIRTADFSSTQANDFRNKFITKLFS